MKILKVLASSIDSQLTPSEIAKSVGVNYVDAANHLEILEVEGIVQHINFGKRTRYYKLNETSPRANAVRDLIKTF
jgi:predicted transcriptional regulator